MRILTSLSVVLAMFLLTACTAAKPGWTYAPAPSPTPIPSIAPSGSAAGAERFGTGAERIGERQRQRAGERVGLRRHWRRRGGRCRGHRLHDPPR